MRRRFQSFWQAVIMMALGPLACGKLGAVDWSDFHLGTWGASLELGYALDREKLRTPDGSPETDFSRRRDDERLSVRNEGFYLIDPGLLIGNLDVSFDAVHDRESSNDTHNTRNARLIGYAFDTTFFGDLPYNGTLYANRSENLIRLPFGRTELTFENHGARLRLREDSPLRDWGFPYFNANLRAEQEHTQETTTSVVGQSFRRDERRNVVSLDAHKGFETSDLEARYEFNDLHDQTFPAGTFQSQTAAVNYSLDFGPTLNRRSDSRLFYYTRNGVSPIKIFTADENLHIEHWSNLFTNYRYLLTRTETPAGTTTIQNGAFDLRHELYRTLTTDARLSVHHQDLPAGVLDAYAGQLAFQYRRSLPGKGTVSARVSGRYQVDDNRLNASQINVTDEAQTAPSPLGAGAGFLLNQSFVVVASIVVVDTRSGARLPAMLGIDYEVSQEGNLTRIIPLPTSAVIQAGDPLAVSYTYELAPSIKFSTVSRSVSAGLDYRWIAISFAHEQSDQKLLSGQDNGFLQNLRRDTAELDLRGTWQTFDGQASAAYVRYDSTFLAYRQTRYSELITFRPVRSLGLALDADRTLTDFSLPVRRTDARSARLSLDWYAPGGWSMNGLVSRRIYKDSLQPTETVNEARLKTRFLYGKLELTSALLANERTRGGFQTTNWGLELRAVRRF